jgi:hypothetical protein
MWDIERAELVFLTKARKSMMANLAMAENMLDFLLANILMARYFYYTTRPAVGYHEASG